MAISRIEPCTCIFWLEDAPAVEVLDLEDPESVAAFVEFWNPLVSAWNPSQNEPKAPVHPSARDPLEMNYTLRDLAQLLNRVQRHTTCTPSYCLRRPKGAPKDAPLVCRFHYPQECHQTTEIKLDDKKRPKIFPKRNDPLLNLHNATANVAGYFRIFFLLRRHGYALHAKGDIF